MRCFDLARLTLGEFYGGMAIKQPKLIGLLKDGWKKPLQQSFKKPAFLDCPAACLLLATNSVSCLLRQISLDKL